MPWLKENGKHYTFDEIKTGVAESSSAIRFCNTWLNGQADFVLQTSGSTGTPKKIAATREQLKASARITATYLKLEPEQTALVCLDVSFVAGLMMLVRALEVGMNIIVTPPEANPLQSLEPAINVDFAAFVPYQIEAILKSPQHEKLNTIKNLIIGGAPLSEQTKVALQYFTNNMYATYGMTETLTHIALQKINEATDNTFQVLPGFDVGTDVRGCLTVKAIHLGNEVIITNDLVELISKNQFLWLGRIDGVINSGGVKIIPEKVEAVVATIFNKLNLLNRFFITGLPNAQLGETVTLVVEGILTKEQTESLRQNLSHTLSRYENPKAIYCLEKFVYTNSGKINRPETILLIGNK
ncbi:MAG TPA: AMP-binding protein [Cyclobacteriaceae bacterium]|nr:AMP-binding protein [Cyclobacteriaceae bacterium]